MFNTDALVVGVLWWLSTVLACVLLTVLVVLKLFGALLLPWMAILVPILGLWAVFTFLSCFKLR